MARVFMTGFENAGMGAFTSLDGAISTSAAQKRTGAYSMNITSGDRRATFTLSADKTEIYVRFGIYATSMPQFRIVFGVLDNVNGEQLRFQIAATSCLPQLANGGGILKTGMIPIVLNAWNCIELYIKIDNVNGVFTFKLNGVIDTSMSYAGDTRYTAVEGLRVIAFGDTSGSAFLGYIDDIAINDVTGGVNDTWIGQGGIRLAFVDGESASHAVDFTPSTPGTNWSLVDEIPVSDADYVENDTVDEYDLYTLDTSSMPAAGTVSAVKWIARAKLDIDGAKITPVIRSEATTEQQADIAVTTTYAEKSLVMDLDPIDNQPWTLVKVNALEIGMAVG